MLKSIWMGVAVLVLSVLAHSAFASATPEGSHKVTVKQRDTVLGSIRREAHTGMNESAFLEEMKRLNPGIDLNRIFPAQELFIPETPDIGTPSTATPQESATTGRAPIVTTTNNAPHTEEPVALTAKRAWVEAREALAKAQEALETEQERNTNLRTALAKVLAEKAEVELRLKKLTDETPAPVQPILKVVLSVFGLFALGVVGSVCFSRGKSSRDRDFESLREKRLQLTRELGHAHVRVSHMERYFPGNRLEFKISNPLDKLDCKMNGHETTIQCTIMRATYDPKHPHQPILEVKSDHANEWIFTKDVKNSYMAATRKKQGQNGTHANV